MTNEQPTQVANDVLITEYDGTFIPLPIDEINGHVLLCDNEVRLIIKDPSIDIAQERPYVEGATSIPHTPSLASYKFTIVLAADASVEMGFCSIRVGNDFYIPYNGHIGFGVHEAHRGKGYATKAARLAIQFVREVHGLQTVYITCYEHNLASKKAIERIEMGCTYVGRFVLPKDRFCGRLPPEGYEDWVALLFRFGEPNPLYN
ncbi:acyl-CoA N-acyltransferase [Chytriomyces sp. MP71]|nr:acyl-CoA N-acyltransferase [Chytriomyces sp. MP71]